MKIDMHVNFRGLPPQVLEILPSDFKYLGRNLEPMRYDEESCTRATVNPNEAKRVIAWGRELRNGESIISMIRLYDHYEHADLLGLDLVEVTRGFSASRCEIVNYKTALNVSWACECCDRVQAEQIDDLDVSLKPKLTVQFTENSEWILARSLVPILKDYGYTFRQLKGTDNYLQLQIDRFFSVCESIMPLKTVGTSCSRCGLTSFIREDLMEGQPKYLGSIPDMTLYMERDISIIRPEMPFGAVMRSSTLLGNIEDFGNPRHVIGDRINYDEITGSYYYPRPLFVAKAELVRKLLEAGATGIDFRPVNVVAEC